MVLISFSFTLLFSDIQAPFSLTCCNKLFPEPSPSLLPGKPLPSLLVQSRAHVVSLLTYICTVQHLELAVQLPCLPPSPGLPMEWLGLGSREGGSAGWTGDGICGNNSQCHVQHMCSARGGILCPESHPALEGQCEMKRTIMPFIERCSSHSVTE